MTTKKKAMKLANLTLHKRQMEELHQFQAELEKKLNRKASTPQNKNKEQDDLAKKKKIQVFKRVALPSVRQRQVQSTKNLGSQPLSINLNIDSFKQNQPAAKGKVEVGPDGNIKQLITVQDQQNVKVPQTQFQGFKRQHGKATGGSRDMRSPSIKQIPAQDVTKLFQPFSPLAQSNIDLSPNKGVQMPNVYPGLFMQPPLFPGVPGQAHPGLPFAPLPQDPLTQQLYQQQLLQQLQLLYQNYPNQNFQQHPFLPVLAPGLGQQHPEQPISQNLVAQQSDSNQDSARNKRLREAGAARIIVEQSPMHQNTMQMSLNQRSSLNSIQGLNSASQPSPKQSGSPQNTAGKSLKVDFTRLRTVEEKNEFDQTNKDKDDQQHLRVESGLSSRGAPNQTQKRSPAIIVQDSGSSERMLGEGNRRRPELHVGRLSGENQDTGDRNEAYQFKTKPAQKSQSTGPNLVSQPKDLVSETPLKRQKSKFQQILDQQSEKSSQNTAFAYVKQLSQSALQMKKSLRKEFNETVEKVNLQPVQIALMKQKTMERIKQLKKQNTGLSKTSNCSLGAFSKKYQQTEQKEEEFSSLENSLEQ